MFAKSTHDVYYEVFSKQQAKHGRLKPIHMLATIMCGCRPKGMNEGLLSSQYVGLVKVYKACRCVWLVVNLRKENQGLFLSKLTFVKD
jgi:hypothetical protein